MMVGDESVGSLLERVVRVRHKINNRELLDEDDIMTIAENAEDLHRQGLITTAQAVTFLTLLKSLI